YFSLADHHFRHSFPTRRSSDLYFVVQVAACPGGSISPVCSVITVYTEITVYKGTVMMQTWSERRSPHGSPDARFSARDARLVSADSEEHTSELQSRRDIVCRLL